MDFLESLYSIENFGIYLFVIIGILVILFLVVLFFGKKDQKKRKELEEKLEQTKVSSTDAFKEVSEPTNVEVPVTPTEPVNMEVKPVEPVSEETPITTNAVLNSDISEPEVPKITDMPTEEPKKEFDFDALADAISKELADLEKASSVEEQPKEEPIELPKVDVEPVHLSAVEPEDIPVSTPKEEVKSKPVMPSVFSSVYVNREKEEPKVTPAVKPEIDLPKKMDLPKKADEKVEEIKPVLEETKDDDIIFR